MEDKLRKILLYIRFSHKSLSEEGIIPTLNIGSSISCAGSLGWIKGRGGGGWAPAVYLSLLPVCGSNMTNNLNFYCCCLMNCTVELSAKLTFLSEVAFIGYFGAAVRTTTPPITATQAPTISKTRWNGNWIFIILHIPFIHSNRR